MPGLWTSKQDVLFECSIRHATTTEQLELAALKSKKISKQQLITPQTITHQLLISGDEPSRVDTWR